MVIGLIQQTNFLGFAVLTTVVMKSTIFCDIMSYNPFKIN
jgi:hypothetical protein